MKTIFDPATNDALVVRAEQLRADLTPQWGIMTPYQMVEHCRLGERMYQLEDRRKRLFIGRIFGKMALKSQLKNADPAPKNSPTHPDFKIKGDGDFEATKATWIKYLKRYATLAPQHYAGFVHPFFGPMTPEQIGRIAYKHTDHHLRQFGV